MAGRWNVALLLFGIIAIPAATAVDCPYNVEHCNAKLGLSAAGTTIIAEATAQATGEVGFGQVAHVFATVEGEVVIYVRATSNTTGETVNVTLSVEQTPELTWDGETSAPVAIKTGDPATRVAFPFTLDQSLQPGKNVFIPWRLIALGEEEKGHVVVQRQMSAPTIGEPGDPLGIDEVGIFAFGGVLGAIVAWLGRGWRPPVPPEPPLR